MTTAKRNSGRAGDPHHRRRPACPASTSSWFACSLPAKTPADIVRKITPIPSPALADPPIKGRLDQLGYSGRLDADELAAHLKAEMEKWGRSSRAAKIKVVIGGRASRDHAAASCASAAAAWPRQARTGALAADLAQPLRALVVPFPPGGGIDAIGRIIGARLSEMWGQQVVVENKPGAGGNIGIEFVAALRSRRLHPLHHLGRTGGQPLPVPVDQLRSGRGFRAGHADLPLPQPDGGAELLAGALGRRSHRLAKANPGKVTFASPGHGSSPHMSGELFKRMAKVDLTHVPYRGAAPAYTDLLAGRIDVHVRGHGVRACRWSNPASCARSA